MLEPIANYVIYVKFAIDVVLGHPFMICSPFGIPTYVQTLYVDTVSMTVSSLSILINMDPYIPGPTV